MKKNPPFLWNFDPPFTGKNSLFKKSFFLLPMKATFECALPQTIRLRLGRIKRSGSVRFWIWRQNWERARLIWTPACKTTICWMMIVTWFYHTKHDNDDEKLKTYEKKQQQCYTDTEIITHYNTQHTQTLNTIHTRVHIYYIYEYIQLWLWRNDQLLKILQKKLVHLFHGENMMGRSFIM